MLKIKSLHLFVIVVPFIFFSCNKDSKPPIKKDKMWDCYHEKTWDSTKIKNALVGEWNWEFISCWSSPEEANYEDFRGLSIEFRADNTLIVKDKSIVMQTCQWHVVEGDSDLFALEITPSVVQLHGRILVTDERVLFDASYIDVCDNYFQRAE